MLAPAMASVLQTKKVQVLGMTWSADGKFHLRSTKQEDRAKALQQIQVSNASIGSSWLVRWSKTR